MVSWSGRFRRCVALGTLVLVANPGVASAQGYLQRGFGARGMEGSQRPNGHNNNNNVGNQIAAGILGGALLGAAALESSARMNNHSGNDYPHHHPRYPQHPNYPQYQPQYQPQYVVPQPQPQPVYQQPVYQQPVYQQPVYQQPVYQQPQAVAPAPVANTVPAPVAAPAAPEPKPNLVPTVAKQAPAARNVSGSALALAGPGERSKVGRALDKKIRDEAKDLARDAEKLGLDTDDLTAKAEDLVKGKATPDQVKELDQAIEAGDAKKAGKLLKDVGVTGDDARELTAGVAAAKALDDYDNALRGKASADEVADAKDALDDALDRYATTNPGAATKVGALREKANDAAQLAEIRDLVRSRPDDLGGGGGGWITTPDQLLIVNDPTLPPGTQWALGPNVVVQGGGAGALGILPGTAADLGIPYVTGTPVAESPAPAGADAGAATGSVYLSNPSENGGPINYVVSTYPYEIKPGQSQTLPGGRSWVISFDRGSGNGQAEYTLTDGAFEFYVGDRGWDLRGKSYAVTLDNSANSHEFHYVANGEAGTVPARQSKTIQSKRPVVLVFDRGDGREPARKELSKGTYQVGVDLRSQSLDLFPGADGALATRGPLAPVSPRGN